MNKKILIVMIECPSVFHYIKKREFYPLLIFDTLNDIQNKI